MQAVLFPLPGLILSPGGKVTLNIFEPRYLQMVKDAMASDLPMAIAHASKTEFDSSVLIPDSGHPYICSDVGYGRIEILGESNKGLIIAVNSLGKAHIEDVGKEASPYIEIDLTPIRLNNELNEQSQFLFRRIKSLTREKLSDFLKTKEEVDIVIDQLSSPDRLLAFYIDHILPDWSQKYELFQIDDINLKIQRLGQMIVGKSALH